MAKKKSPNPNGKKGSVKHQQTVAEQVAKHDGPGKDVRTEYLVPVSNGLKSKRFVDVAVLENGVEGLFVQVCRMNKDGKTPVKRERDAAKDIHSTHPDVPIQFVNYRKED